MPGSEWRAITFSENDQYLAAAGRHDQALLWRREGDTSAIQEVWQVPGVSRGYLESFVFSKDGSVLLALPQRESLQIWKSMPDGPQLVATLNAEPPVHFIRDGRYLVANQNNHVQIWDGQTYTPIEHPPIPEYFAISRNGTVLLSYNSVVQIQIWDGRALLPVESRDKQIVAWGQVKQNRLLQNFPNPFNPETWIPFQLANDSAVTIRIYTPTGQVVRVLPLGTMPAGDYSSQSQAVYWDGQNEIGEPVGSGIYLYTINAGNFSATRKMLIQK